MLNVRIDCKHLAPCGRHSLYFCQRYSMICCHWEKCTHLSKRAKAVRKRKQALEATGRK